MPKSKEGGKFSVKLVDSYTKEEFEQHKASYAKMNDSFSHKLIFHVGTGLGGMLEAMMWCYVNKVKFTLYADDATFADKRSCEVNRDSLNCLRGFLSLIFCLCC